MKSLSRVQLFATPWTVAYQAPQSMEFSRQEYWSVLPFPSPGDLPDPGTEPRSPALQADALLSEPPGKPIQYKAVSSPRPVLTVLPHHGSLKMQGKNIFKPLRLKRTEQASNQQNCCCSRSGSGPGKPGDWTLIKLISEKGVVPIPPVNTHRGGPNHIQWSGNTSEAVSSVVRHEGQTGEWEHEYLGRKAKNRSNSVSS